MVFELLRTFSRSHAPSMVWNTIRLTCWPIESHFELDCLEDIFKENGREGALKPVLSTILTPGLCAIYSTYGLRDFWRKRAFSDVSGNSECANSTAEETEDLSNIHLHVEEVDCLEENETSNLDNCRSRYNQPPRSPELLSPPVENLTLANEMFPSGSIAVFVSGLEAERQRQELREFGLDVAPRLAERRATYARKFMMEERDESAFIQHNIEQAVENKIKQLQMAEELDKKGTSRMGRRAKLWRRCANMAEVLAKEEAETILFRKKYHNAAIHVFGGSAKNMVY